ncbi:MAG: S-layer homology domain-containing protein [Oscillospiraceae bacterium]|nr:S-layer homology domain-containing protein [Oscillospiraceae bacterium]
MIWNQVDAMVGCYESKTLLENCYYNSEVCSSDLEEGKPTATFKSGEIAYLLQGTQEGQIWGQSLPGDDYPALTSDPAKRVYRVTFVSEDATIHTVYTNGAVEKPADPVPGTSDRQFLFWSIGEEESAAEFDFQTPISADTTLYAHWKTISESTPTLTPTPTPTPTPAPTPTPTPTTSTGGGGWSSSRDDGPTQSAPAEQEKPEPTEIPAEETTTLTVPVAERFADVKSGDWFVEATQYVCDRGLMSGTGADSFAPQVPASRAMMVPVLYRLEGEPTVTDSAFSDVAEGKYYADAVSWASANGLVNGYNDGSFQPNNGITREQLAAVLYRYATMKGWDMDQAADLSTFTDANQISRYARPAMEWANAAGILTGTDRSTLVPKAETTRAEAAVVLMRFCEWVKEKESAVELPKG